MKTYSMLLLFLIILLSVFVLETAFIQPKPDIQLNAKNILSEPFISATNAQQSMQNFMQGSEKDIIFIENLGQIRDSEGEERPDVLFLTRSQGVDMYITSSGITYVFRKTEGDIQEFEDMRKDEVEEPKTSLYRLDMEFVGINENINIEKELAVEQQFNYYTPEHPNGISPKAYKKITIENIYDGIDLVYYEKEGKMKYDFIVKTGANTQKIKMKYNGAESVYIDKYGSVVVTTPMGEIREEKPYTYSMNTAEAIESEYEVKDNIVQFDIAEYNKSEDIIIDPFRQWATYYGGSDTEYGWGTCSDNSGNLYITGYTLSTDFPTQPLTGAYNQTTYGGGAWDAFILKFNSNGARIWATYYGGSDIDYGFGICTDNSGNVYVTGETESSNFPTQTLSGAYNQGAIGGNQDVFILKFNSNGARIWATYYGGSGWDGWDGGFGYNICTDNSGNFYVTAMTTSSDLPMQILTGAYNQSNLNSSRDAFILKFNSNCARTWATYYGGNANDWGLGVCTDNSDNLFVNGRTQSTDFPIQIVTGAYNQTTFSGNYDGFLSKFDSNGVCFWCTYYGGYATDYIYSICTDNSGNLYATGKTNSDPNLGIGFPTQTLSGAYNQTTFGGGYFDAFVLKFNNSCARTWATFYGGSARDEGYGICTDVSGNLYLTGTTQSDVYFPTQIQTGAYNQTAYGGGTWDAFLLEFNSNSERTWATYYGGDGRDVGYSICMSSSNNLYITGLTKSNDFPTQNLTGAFNQSAIAGEDDAFILKFHGFCTADFTASDDTICVGNTISFTDQSNGNITSWDWTFEGGTPPASTIQNPTVTYNTAGIFDVQLIVSDGTLIDTLLMVDMINVRTIPGQANTPAGPDEICWGEIYQYTTNSVDYADSYTWEIDPADAGIISGNDTIGTLSAADDWTGPFTIQVRAENDCGDGPWSSGFQGTLYSKPIAFQLNGGGGYCEGGTGIELTLDGSETGVDYELYFDDVPTGTVVAGTGSAISFGFQTEEGMYTALGYTAYCSEYMMGDAWVYVIFPPGQAATPTGPESVCNNELTQYSTTGSTDADTIIWTLTPPEAGMVIPDGLDATVDWDDIFAGTAYLSVYGENDCGTGPPSDDLEIEVNASPTPEISGLTFVCQYDVAEYTTGDTPGSTFSWNVSGGTIIAGTGTYQITVEWGAAGTGYINVTETNTDSCSVTTEDYEVIIDLCPKINELSQAKIRIYPNPFNKATIFEYQLEQPAKVVLTCYNHLGQQVETLVNEHQSQGKHTITWHAKGLPSGIYFYRLYTGRQLDIGKIMVLR